MLTGGTPRPRSALRLDTASPAGVRLFLNVLTLLASYPANGGHASGRLHGGTPGSGRLRYWLHPSQAPTCKTGLVASGKRTLMVLARV